MKPPSRDCESPAAAGGAVGVIVTVVIWPVTVMTDVMGVGVQVDLAGALDVVDGIRGVEEVLDDDSDVID